MSRFGVHLIVAFTPMFLIGFTLIFLVGLPGGFMILNPEPSGFMILNTDFALFGILLLFVLFDFFAIFSLTFILGSLIPDILEPWSLNRRMHRGKHHSWRRLKWLTRTGKKLLSIFAIGITALFALGVLVGLTSWIDLSNLMANLSIIWLLFFAAVLGFIAGYIIHLKLDSCHPLGLPE